MWETFRRRRLSCLTLQAPGVWIRANTQEVPVVVVVVCCLFVGGTLKNSSLERQAVHLQLQIKAIKLR